MSDWGSGSGVNRKRACGLISKVASRSKLISVDAHLGPPRPPFLVRIGTLRIVRRDIVDVD